MKTQAEVEVLAIEMIDKYLGFCSCDSPDDISNALMKLCSVAGVKMVNTTGNADAYNRLIGTAYFIHKLGRNKGEGRFVSVEDLIKFPYLRGTGGTSISKEDAESLQRNNNAVISKEFKALDILCIEMSREVIDPSGSQLFLDMAYTNLVGISKNHTFIRRFDKIAAYPAKYNTGRVIEEASLEAPVVVFSSRIDLKDWIEEQKQAGTL